MSINDTIAAVATGKTVSAIGIARISGETAITVADKIFRARNGIRLQNAKDRHMYYGELFDARGELLDICMCVISHAPNSYTGEDTAEFHCHGSPVVLSEVLRALFMHGVRQAEAGEFTKRAFLNGRMDLTQAEAVIDLIEAETPLAAKNAAGQLQGAVCGKMNQIYDKLIDIIAHFHAVIDYPDEDIDDFTAHDYLAVLHRSVRELQSLLDTHERGKLLHTGIPAAIVGRVNTGKSSLLNALLGYERAIVTDIAGTTRDTVEEKVLIGNVLLRLADTAGLRDTDDTVEKLGVERTLEALEGAGLVLVVLDGSQPLQEDDFKVIEAVSSVADDVPVIVAVNKSDLPAELGDNDLRITARQPMGAKKLSQNGTAFQSAESTYVCHVSALTGEGVDELCGTIKGCFPDSESTPAGEIITSTRQAQALGRAISSLERAVAALTDKVSPDAVLTDIEDALGAIGEVTGKTMREDVVSRIFERFCVGK